jgi:hypothetical protein
MELHEEVPPLYDFGKIKYVHKQNPGFHEDNQLLD